QPPTPNPHTLSLHHALPISISLTRLFLTPLRCTGCLSPPPRLLPLSRIMADGIAPPRLLLPEWTLLPALTVLASTSPALVRVVIGRDGSARLAASLDASLCGIITSSP